MPQPALAAASSAPGFASGRGGRAVETRLVAGAPQAVAWDLESGDRRVVTGGPQGVALSEIEPDGGHLWWFDADEGGAGIWRREPFGGGAARPALAGVPAGMPRGLAFDGDGAAATVCVGLGEHSRCYVGPPGDGAREVYAAAGYRCVVDLSPDSGLLALAGPPAGPQAVVLCDLRTGEATFLGGDGRGLWALEFDPQAGAGSPSGPRLLLMAERESGFTVATWTADTGLLLHPLTFPTTATAQWYLGKNRVLIQHEIAGRSRLLIADLDGREPRELPLPAGTVHDLSCAPDGALHCLWSSASSPAALLVLDPAAGDGPAVGTAPRHATAPPSTAPTPAAARDLWTRTGYGQIHSFLTPPPGDPPWPTVFLVHGGPATHDRDGADPRVEALAAAGYAVVRTNYRGSTGYGPAWQHGYGHRVGLAQVEDLAAVRAHLLELGLADPDRIQLCGYSWGGYLALLAMGVQPDLWSAAAAVYPIADYPRCYATTTPALREVDAALFGGTPQQVPQRYAAASPLTYADRVRGPVLLIGAVADERCPPGQLRGYAEALRRRGVPHRMVWRDGGHAGYHLDEQAGVMALALDFLRAARRRPPQLPDASAPGYPPNTLKGGEP